MSAAPEPRPERVRRLFLSLVAVGILYVNAAVILNPSLPKVGLPALPLSESLRDAFLIFGVFSYYETNNQDLTIWGLANNWRTGEQYWKQLPTEDFFPFSRGEQNSRLWATRPYDRGRQEHWKAWQFMGNRIRERYNRQHPDDPVEQVGFQSLTWPRRAEDFHAGRAGAEASKRFWIVAGRTQ